VRAKVPGNYSAELRAALEGGEGSWRVAPTPGRAVSAELERLAGEADAAGSTPCCAWPPMRHAPVGAFSSCSSSGRRLPGASALPFAALHGGDRVYRVDDSRLHGVRIERVGEVAGPDGGQVLVRAPELPGGTRVMVTHLPHAVDGLRVEEVR